MEQLEQRDESSNWIGGICIDPLAEIELVLDEETQVRVYMCVPCN